MLFLLQIQVKISKHVILVVEVFTAVEIKMFFSLFQESSLQSITKRLLSNLAVLNVYAHS